MLDVITVVSGMTITVKLMDGTELVYEPDASIRGTGRCTEIFM